MEYINPLFNNTEIVKPKQPASSKVNRKSPRSIRSDKTHNVKFPVTQIMQMQLKSYHRQAKRLYRLKGKGDITQTTFNTLLLQFGLSHKDIINWNHEYKDTKVYMHTKLLESVFESAIGGPHGLTVQKNLSDRKVVFHVILSVLKWLEGEGSLEEIL